MKKLLLHTLLLVVASISFFSTATAQTMPPVQNYIYVYPNDPTSTDSVTVAYIYVSGDACPDYYLVKDSIVSNRIYISKRNIERPSSSICATVLTKFSTTLNLRALPENTQIYFEGTLIKTIQYPCILDRIGTVVEGSGDCSGQLYIQETTIYLSAIPRLYALSKTTVMNMNGSAQTGLKPGDKVKFGGTEIKNDSNTTSPCRIVGVVNCYEVIPIPPVGCVKDKKGIVVNGEKECAGQLFIQEYSPISSARQLYIIQGISNTNNNVTIATGLKVGDMVIFGGYPLKNDSSTTYGCRTVGVATCYEAISIPPVCVMDKMGIVTEFKNSSTLVKDSLTADIYAINNVKLTAGTLLKFKGTKIECITTPCYNIVECYTVIAPPACVKDKEGVVVAGTGGCTGQLFIEEATPYMSAIRRLYSIKDLIVPTSSTPIKTGLKIGDKVKFGGYLATNDSNKVSLCYTIGVATCYEVISTPPPACVMDKEGMVVPGIDGCTGQLFIQDISSSNTTIQLYAFKNIDPATNSAKPTGLKTGDKVKFGGYPLKNDSTRSILCPIVGIASCYELITLENTFTLTGSAFAGTEIMNSGSAILYKKGYSKAIASCTITNGTFTFANLTKADYTVYVIPTITVYKNFMPTFYIDKIRFKKADYLTLDKNVSDMVVNLKQFKLPVGTGKITGNIFFENYNLKDSILVGSGMQKTLNLPMNNSAINTPVVLYNGNSEPIAWTTTDLSGNYTFENIPFDSFTVVSETASAEGQSSVNLTSGNSTANADVLLKSSQTETKIVNPGDVVLNVYPNPVLDKLTITLAVNERISIYSTIGELLIQRNLISGDNTIDLSAINKGIYFAKIGKATIKVIKK